MANPKLIITARIIPVGAPFQVKGRQAETLLALVAAGPRGLTSLEGFRAGWAVRLAAYVHGLRKDFGLAIETVREEHEGAVHGRYVLTCPVQILSGLPVAEAAA